MWRGTIWNCRDDDPADRGPELLPDQPHHLPSGDDEETEMDREMVERIRAAKIERIRGQVHAGTYSVNVERLARRVMSSVML